MTGAPALYCCICERPIRGVIREDDRGGVLLCPACAAKPTLLAAFREGRARHHATNRPLKQEVTT